MTVRQLMQNIDSYELQEWATFFKVRQDKQAPIADVELKGQLKSAFAGAKAKAQRAGR